MSLSVARRRELAPRSYLDQVYQCARYPDWLASSVCSFCFVSYKTHRQTSNTTFTRFEDMNRLIEAVKLAPVIDKVFQFEQLRDAYEYLESQQHVGKVVVRVSKD